MTDPGQRMVNPIPKSDLSTPGHPRGCPCKPCVGRRSRRSGKAKQSAARKVIEKVSGTQAHWRGNLANEETFSHLPIRVEIKSGQIVRSAWTRYMQARAQSDAANPIGNSKPYATILMAPGTTTGLFVCRLDELQAIVDALGG